MFEDISTRILPVIIAAGIPAMVILFYGEGAIVGKVFQVPLIFIGYVTATSPSTQRLLFLCILCILATVVGQWTIYRSFNKEAPELIDVGERVPALNKFLQKVANRIGERKMDLIEGWFEKGGALAIIFTNAVPVIRCLIAIPAGLNNYSREKFLLATAIGNVVYIFFLLGAVYGIGVLTRLFL